MALNTIHIHGHHGEGGGQLLRNAVAYSALLGIPIHVSSIRAGRDKPGLKNQHLYGLRLVSEISTTSSLEGATIGSTEIQFTPGQLTTGSYTADTKTAGSITLLLQVSLPCILFASPKPADPNSNDNQYSSTLTLRGGTNATQAPQIDYTTNIFLPFLKTHFPALQDRVVIDITKRGYYPRGGGQVVISVTGPTKLRETDHPLKLDAITLTDRGQILRVRGTSYVAGSLPKKLAYHMRDAALPIIRSYLDTQLDSAVNVPIIIDILQEHQDPRAGSGSGIILWAETDTGCIIGGSDIGQKGRDVADVGRGAAEELVRNLSHGGCVDEYLQDQIIIFLALAHGTSEISCGPITLHTETAIWLAEQMTTAKFEVLPPNAERPTHLIRCQGAAFVPF